MTHISPRLPAHVPTEIAALPVRLHPDHGPLLLNRDVARLFGVGTSTLRRRRANGRFPATIVQEPTASWYRLDDIVRVYQESFSNFFSAPTKNFCSGSGVTEAGLEHHPGDTCRDCCNTTVIIEQIHEAVRATLFEFLEFEAESPVTIASLSQTIAEQQQTVSFLNIEVKRLSATQPRLLRPAKRRYKPRFSAVTSP